MNVISKSENEYIGYYRLDTKGTKFIWNNRLFIKVYKDAEIFIKKLFDSGLIDELIKNNLFVNTWISELKFEDCGLVLEQEYYPQTLGLEYWSDSMIVDAAKTFVLAAEKCVDYGFSLVDTHNNNIIYVNNSFLICDIGAFDKEMNFGKYTPAIRNIKSNFYYPLLAGRKELLGDDTPYRVSCVDEEHRMRCAYPCISPNIIKFILKWNGVCKLACEGQRLEEKTTTFIKILIFKIISAYIKFYLGNKKIGKIKTISELERLKKDLGKFDIVIDSTWSNYHQKMSLDAPSDRFTTLMNKIKEMNVKDSIELGGNSGYFSRLLLMNDVIENGIVTDYDRGAIDKAYKATLARKDRLLTYRLDFNNLSSTTADILRSDVLICLALTHHLLLAQGVDIDYMMESMKKLTRKYIVIEFMPLGLWGGGELPEIPEWYSLEWFTTHFKMSFDMIDLVQTESNRIALFGKLKE